jgi:hypothetical protein
MSSPHVTTATLATIRSAGFHIDWTSTLDSPSGVLLARLLICKEWASGSLVEVHAG